MKTRLLLTSILISAIASAQVKRTLNSSLVKPTPTVSSTPAFGFRAGLLSSGMRGNAVKSLEGLTGLSNGILSTSDRTGYFAGAYASIPFSSTISIEPGAYYALKGYQMNAAYSVKDLEFLSANATARLDMQYVDIPLVLKAAFDGLQVFAGPQFSYLIKSQLKTSAGALGFNLLNTSMDITQQFNRWDAGITAGVGYQFDNGLNIMASYDYGMTKVDANKNMDAYNRSYRIGIGIKL